jgi:hypothetical protein
MESQLTFRIVGARPLGGMPPKMFVDCQLDASPPISFSICMTGRGLDDPAAGRSPKALVFEERAAAQRFLKQFGEAFGAPLPDRAPSDDAPIRLEFDTCLVARTEDTAHDRWNATDEAELDCDYSLSQRNGAFLVRNEEALEPLMRALTDALF